ncbi:MAG: helix-turn-helix domain-containing protein [Tannerellaceae bacterium]|nr:helix-turn-helix domain-containing protein [Tannerellaceae bacterium]
MEINYLNINDVSKKLNIAKSTLYAYVGKNKIPFIKLGGKLLFPESDLTNWLNSMKQAVISEREVNK